MGKKVTSPEYEAARKKLAEAYGDSIRARYALRQAEKALRSAREAARTEFNKLY